MKSNRSGIMWLCALSGIILWVVDALLDKIMKFPQKPFLDLLLFDAPRHEFIMRPLVLILFILVGITLSLYMNKMKEGEEQKRYQLLFDNVKDAAFLSPLRNMGLWGKFAEANKVACKNLGYSKEELQQLCILDIIIEGRRSETSQILNKITSAGSDIFETALISKDGREIPVEMNAQVMDWAGEAAFLFLARDISGRLQKDKEIKRLASFPQMNPNPILEVNPERIITFANEASRKALGSLGTHELQAFFPADLKAIIKAAKETGGCQFYREVTVGDALFEVFIHYIPQFDVARLHPKEITAQRRAEEALQESEKQCRILNAHLLTIQDAERWRMSRELHDEVGQSLMYIKFQLTSIRSGLTRDQGKLKKDCEGLLVFIDGLLENIRRLIQELIPTILEELGLSSSLRHLLNDFAESHNITFSLDLDEIDPLFPEGSSRVNIYRIFQEALSNIGRHSQATHISATIKKEDGKVSFLIQDNGVGFSMEEVTGPGGKKGIGLVSLHERVRMLGGSLQIWSAGGQGTRISFFIPTGLTRK